MSSPLNYTSYQFLVTNFTKDELVAIQKGDPPGYLKAKLQELGAYFTAPDITNLMASYGSSFLKFIWRRASSQPTTPTGNDPTNTGVYGEWQNTPYESDGATLDFLWMSSGYFNVVIPDVLMGTWSEPVKLSGEGKQIKVLYAKGDDDTIAPTKPTGNDPESASPQLWFSSSSLVEPGEQGIHIWESRGLFIDNELVGDWGDPIFVEYRGRVKVVYIFKRAAKSATVLAPTDPDPTGPNPGDWKFDPEDAPGRLWMSKAEIVGDGFYTGGWSTPVMIDGGRIAVYYEQVFKCNDSVPDPISPVDTLNEGVLNGLGWFYDPQDAIDNYSGSGKTSVFVSVIRLEDDDGDITVVENWSDPVGWTGLNGDDGNPGLDVEAIFVPFIPSITLSEDNTGNEVPNISDIPVSVRVQGLTGDLTVASSDIDAGSDFLTNSPYTVVDGKVDLVLPYADITSFPVEITCTVGTESTIITVPEPVKLEYPVSIQLSNDNHTFTIPSSGVIEEDDYDDADCLVEVYRGNHKLDYVPYPGVPGQGEYTIQNLGDSAIHADIETEGTDAVIKVEDFSNNKSNALVTFEVVVPSWNNPAITSVFHKQISYSKTSHLPDYEATIISLNEEIEQLKADKTIIENSVLNLKDTLENTSHLQGLIANALASNPEYFRRVIGAISVDETNELIIESSE